MTTAPLPAGVIVREHQRKGTLPADLLGAEPPRDLITERLYTCPNGLQLGARRGSRGHLAGTCDAHPDGEGTWEVVVLDEHGIARGESAGWVTEEQLVAAVDRLANWYGNRCEANAEAVRGAR